MKKILYKKEVPLEYAYQLLEPGPVVMVTTAYEGAVNIMTMSWHMMLDFMPPLFGCVISDQNYSFHLLKKSKECVINIPTVELINQVVGVGNCSGKQIDKFTEFSLTQEPASIVQVPMIAECYANLECRVVDTSMVKTYELFILEVVAARKVQSKRRQRTFHHCGNGVFVVDGTIITLPSKKK